MIGDMIAKVRTEKNMTKTELARLAGIDIGHLTHIEKGERNPSHKTLRNICNALDIPYQPLMYTYDKCLNEEQENYGFIQHIAYDKVLAVDKLDSFITCPTTVSGASIAVKIENSDMEPIFKKGEYVFIEFNSLLNNNDIGLFCVNEKLFIRKFFNENGKIILKAENDKTSDISVDSSADFYIVGKILGK